jgi:hypothetical protein
MSRPAHAPAPAPAQPRLIQFSVEEVNACVDCVVGGPHALGSSADVFRVELRGKGAAVKLLRGLPQGVCQELVQREMDTLGRAAHHPNVVQLIGYDGGVACARACCEWAQPLASDRW